MSSSKSSTTSSQTSNSYQTTLADSGNQTSNWAQNLSDVGNYTVNLAPPLVAGSGASGKIESSGSGSLLLPLGLGAVVLFFVIYFYTRK